MEGEVSNGILLFIKMKMIFGCLILLIILYIIPITIGQVVLKYVDINTNAGKVILSHIMGFIIMLSIWQLVVVPMALLDLSFRHICVIYGLLIAIVLAICLYYSIKKQTFKKNIRISNQIIIDKKKWLSYLMFFAFIVLLCVQLYYALFYSRTYMTEDSYSTFSSMAIDDNYINSSYFETGTSVTHTDSYWVQRTLQSILYFPALLSIVSGVKTTTICYTIMSCFILLLAYEAYFLVCDKLFKSYENRFIALYFIELLYVFGYHSHYSLTFRMLGPNYEGKAILATVITPFVFWVILQILEQGYKTSLGCVLFIISIASTGLTLGACYTLAALIVLLVIFGFVRKHGIKMLLYCVWGGLYPGICAMWYLLSR